MTPDCDCTHSRSLGNLTLNYRMSKLGSDSSKTGGCKASGMFSTTHTAFVSTSGQFLCPMDDFRWQLELAGELSDELLW